MVVVDHILVAFAAAVVVGAGVGKSPVFRYDSHHHHHFLLPAPELELVATGPEAVSGSNRWEVHSKVEHNLARHREQWCVVSRVEVVAEGESWSSWRPEKSQRSGHKTIAVAVREEGHHDDWRRKARRTEVLGYSSDLTWCRFLERLKLSGEATLLQVGAVWDWSLGDVSKLVGNEGWEEQRWGNTMRVR